MGGASRLRGFGVEGGDLRKLAQLQILRAVAASLVIVDHAVGTLVKEGYLPGIYKPISFLFGGLGVSVFFVISGLIMMRTSADEFGKPKAAGRFAFRRIVRVAPLYWIATLVVVGSDLLFHRGFN